MNHELETSTSESSPNVLDGPPAAPDASKHPSDSPLSAPTISVDSSPLAVAPGSNETDDVSFAALARLTPAQYDRVRKAEARRLGIRIETLDSEVAKCRPDDYDAQARAVKLPPVEPWPDPVDGQEVLTQVVARFVLRVVLPPGAADAITLWEA